MNYSWHVYERHSGEFMKVASGHCGDLDDAIREGRHYALQYAQDYTVRLRIFEGRRVLMREEWSMQ